MAQWTVIGTGIEGDLDGKSFGATLDTDTGNWTVGGPSVDRFFVTKSGTFYAIGAPENGTKLASTTSKEVAFFKALNGFSGVGDTGTGRASEKGANFHWKLESK